MCRVAPRATSLNRPRPRPLTLVPGGGSLARSIEPPSLASLRRSRAKGPAGKGWPVGSGSRRSRRCVSHAVSPRGASRAGLLRWSLGPPEHAPAQDPAYREQAAQPRRGPQASLLGPAARCQDWVEALALPAQGGPGQLRPGGGRAGDRQGGEPLPGETRASDRVRRRAGGQPRERARRRTLPLSDGRPDGPAAGGACARRGAALAFVGTAGARGQAPALLRGPARCHRAGAGAGEPGGTAPDQEGGDSSAARHNHAQLAPARSHR